MKIANVEGIHLTIPSRYDGPQPRGAPQLPYVEMLLVRVTTDAGLVGWGEAFGHAACATTKAALDSLVTPLFIGGDAADIAALHERVRRALHGYGPGGAVQFALSGIDIALWDLRGQTEGMPVHRLLGGDGGTASVPAYASLLRYGDADSVGLAVRDAIAHGHTAVKLHEASEESVAAARAAAGPDVALMLDVNCRWEANDAVKLARRLEQFGLRWIEEPAWPCDPAVMARIVADVDIPIAAGENVASLDELGRLATAGIAFLQPSVAKIGGLSAAVRAAALVRRGGARLAPHSAYFGPALAATIHLCAAHDLSCEWYNCRLEANPCGLIPVNGAFALPYGNGLGIAIDPAAITDYRLKP